MQPSNPNTILIHIQLTAQMLACLDEKGSREKGGGGVGEANERIQEMD